MRPPSATCKKNDTAEAKPQVVKLLPLVAATSRDSLEGRFTSKTSSPVPEAWVGNTKHDIQGSGRGGVNWCLQKRNENDATSRVENAILYPGASAFSFELRARGQAGWVVAAKGEIPFSHDTNGAEESSEGIDTLASLSLMPEDYMGRTLRLRIGVGNTRKGHATGD